MFKNFNYRYLFLVKLYHNFYKSMENTMLKVVNHIWAFEKKDTFINNRIYRILLRLRLNDGRYRIFDNNFDFKVIS